MDMNEIEIETLPSFSKNEMIEKVIEVLQENNKIYACDLHHYAFNENHYIENAKIAEEVIDNYGFKKALKEVLEYERTSFGEIVEPTKYIDNPIQLASMLMYIKGEEFLYNENDKIKEILDENWNNYLPKEASDKIIEILKEELER